MTTIAQQIQSKSEEVRKQVWIYNHLVSEYEASLVAFYKHKTYDVLTYRFKDNSQLEVTEYLRDHKRNPGVVSIVTIPDYK